MKEESVEGTEDRGHLTVKSGKVPIFRRTDLYGVQKLTPTNLRALSHCRYLPAFTCRNRFSATPEHVISTPTLLPLEVVY